MQAYVIATSTLVEISKVDVSKFDDAYFKSSDKAQKKKGEDAFFEEKSEKKELNADYIDNQKKVSHNIFPSQQAGTCCQATAYAPCLSVVCVRLEPCTSAPYPSCLGTVPDGS